MIALALVAGVAYCCTAPPRSRLLRTRVPRAALPVLQPRLRRHLAGGSIPLPRVVLCDRDPSAAARAARVTLRRAGARRDLRGRVGFAIGFGRPDTAAGGRVAGQRLAVESRGEPRRAVAARAPVGRHGDRAARGEGARSRTASRAGAAGAPRDRARAGARSRARPQAGRLRDFRAAPALPTAYAARPQRSAARRVDRSRSSRTTRTPTRSHRIAPAPSISRS